MLTLELWKVYAALIAVAVVLVITRLRTGRGHLPVPPGPKPVFFIGNLLDVPRPTDAAWKVYAEWGKKYGMCCYARTTLVIISDNIAGNMIYFKVMNKSVLVINSATIAHDLLDKRSLIYSSRPHVPMAGDV